MVFYNCPIHLKAVRRYILAMEQALHDMGRRVEAHERRIEKLESQTRKNSHNSSKPPSSDPPVSTKKRKQKKRRQSKGGKSPGLRGAVV
jgi:transposase